MVSKFLIAFIPILPILAYPGPSLSTSSNLQPREDDLTIDQERLNVVGYSKSHENEIDLNLSASHNDHEVCPPSTTQCSGVCDIWLACNEGYRFHLPPSAIDGPKPFEFFGPHGLLFQGELHPNCNPYPTPEGRCTNCFLPSNTGTASLTASTTVPSFVS